MVARRLIAALGLCLIAPPLEASPAPDRVAQWRPFIAEASRRFGVPERWIISVMRAESGGRTELGGRPITSRAGAMGLMQVMPATYAEMRRLYGLGPDPYDPRDNILAGTAFLAAMHVRFGHPGLFAAYNAGPTRYAEFLERGRPLPSETVGYMRSHIPAGDAENTAIVPSAGIFFPLTTVSPASSGSSASALFIPLSDASGPER